MCTQICGLTDFYTHKVSLCVMWIQHQNIRVAWLGAGDSHPFGSRTKCSCPADAHSASECENKLWNRGFMYKWRGKLLLLLHKS